MNYHEHKFAPWRDGERTVLANWRKPLQWNREAASAGVRARVFCASMADWLDPEVPVEWLADLLALIAETPNLDWLLLTKTPERWRERLHRVTMTASVSAGGGGRLASSWLGGEVPPNVWLGVSVEHQRHADERIPALLRIPARVRFLSMEPLLAHVSIDLRERWDGGCVGGCLDSDLHIRLDSAEACRRCGWPLGGTPKPPIDWVIVGGESGPGARPCHVEWIASIVGQCRYAGVPVFVRHFGSVAMATTEPSGAPDDGGDLVPMSLRDPNGGDMDEWPIELRVRQFPEVR